MDFAKLRKKPGLGTAEDRELVSLAQSGDQKAFVEIVSRYQNLVVGVAFSILQDFATSEDAAQDCFVKAWKQMTNLREPEKLRPWLTQIARNSALDHLRKNRSTHSANDHFESIEDPGKRPDESLAQSEERATVLKALASLPEKYRLPLVLYYCDEKSIRAVAEALNLSEDAVKQRLSRGRARLRKRMDGLIESVLGSRRANALFIASVAASIGALTKPSAMAATAINSTSLVMTSTKSTLSTTALILAVSLPIGYSAHKVIEKNSPSPAVTTSVESSSSSKSPAETFEISLKESTLVQQWRKLRANYGDDHSDLIQLQAEIAALENRIHRRAFTAVLISEWSILHPHNGIKFFREKENADWERDLFLKELFRKDASQAIDVLMASGEGWEELAPRLLQEIAKQSPQRLAAFVDQLPARTLWRYIESAFELFAQNDLQGARTAAKNLSGPHTSKALIGVARAWAAQDAPAALAWAEAIENEDLRQSTVGAVLTGWARTDAREALERLANSTFKGGLNGPASRILAEAAEHDFETTILWIRDNPDQLGSGASYGLKESIGQRLQSDPTALLSYLDESGTLGSLMRTVKDSINNFAPSSCPEIMAWLLNNETSPAKIELEEMVLNSLAFNQTATAMKIVDGIVDPEKKRAATKTVVSGMINYGHIPDTADQIFDTVSTDWQKAIAIGFFEELVPESVSNFETWADRMTHLPEDHQISAHQTMGHSWAKIEPLNAVDWALSKSDESRREAAIEGVSSGWASRSPGDTREWIESQLTGSEQKIAASGFVQGSFWEHNEEALAMMTRIPSEQARVELIEKIIETNQTNEWSKVMEVIEESAFSEAQKSKLQNALNNQK